AADRFLEGGKTEFASSNCALKSAAEALKESFKSTQMHTFGSLMAEGTERINSSTDPSLQLEWLFIDEAQDMNPAQATFVNNLQQKTKCRIFAIGDCNQAIYGFRGANTDFLDELVNASAGSPPTAQAFQLNT